jgi:CheY-like chemotaxis protein
LEKLGFTFDVVTNGMDALDAVRRSGPYVAVLMDCQMPAMDGFEATKGIRTFASLPIIAMTASHSDESKAACLAAGMNDFLTKPIAMRDLKRVLPRRGTRD